MSISGDHDVRRGGPPSHPGKFKHRADDLPRTARALQDSRDRSIAAERVTPVLDPVGRALDVQDREAVGSQVLDGLERDELNSVVDTLLKPSHPLLTEPAVAVVKEEGWNGLRHTPVSTQRVVRALNATEPNAHGTTTGWSGVTRT